MAHCDTQTGFFLALANCAEKIPLENQTFQKLFGLTRKFVNILWQKIRENVAVISEIDFDNIDLTRKNCDFFMAKKFVKMLRL